MPSFLASNQLLALVAINDAHAVASSSFLMCVTISTSGPSKGYNTKRGSHCNEESNVGDVAILESWFETVQKQPKGKCLRDVRRDL